MKVIKIIIVFVLTISLFQCKSPNNSLVDEISLEKKIILELEEWGIKSNSQVQEKDSSSIDINITLLKKKGSDSTSFFLDRESNQIMINLLTYVFYDELKNFDFIKYNVIGEGFDIGHDFTGNKRTVEFAYESYSNHNQLFSLYKYVFKNMSYLDVLRSTQLINHISKEFDEYYFSGSFWDLFYGFVLSSNTHEQINEFAFHFIAFVAVAKAFALSNIDYKINIKSLEYIIADCGFNPTLVDLTYQELVEMFNKGTFRNIQGDSIR